MSSTILGVIAAAILALGPDLSEATVHVGDPAPGFTKSLLGGGTASRSDYDGKIVVLFLLGYG